MDIPYRERSDGTLAVLRIHAEHFEKQPGDRLPREPTIQP